MTRYLLVICFCLVVPTSVALAQVSNSGTNSANSNHAAIAAAAKELAADLKEARELIKKVTDKATRDRLELLITRSELKALEFEKSLAGAATATSTAPMAISQENFDKLLKGLKSESFDDGKASFVATFAAQSHLNCAQARELLKAFSFDESRIKSAVVLYPRITDKQNFFTVLDVFTFDVSRKEVREKLSLKK
jgi:hypothetical protein